jgi:hypothetical protein
MFFLIGPVTFVMSLDRTAIVVAAPTIQHELASRWCRCPGSSPDSLGPVLLAADSANNAKMPTLASAS